MSGGNRAINRTYHSNSKGGEPEGSGRTILASLPGAALMIWGPVVENDGGSMGSSPLGPRAPHRVRAHTPARSLSINNSENFNTRRANFVRREYFANIYNCHTRIPTSTKLGELKSFVAYLLITCMYLSFHFVFILRALYIFRD